MQPWAIIGTFVGILAFLSVIVIELNSSFDKKIENRLQDPAFIRKIANEVRLPFIIFDEDKSIIVDAGAMAIIDKIEIRKEGNELSEIIVTPNRYLSVAPILESLNPKLEFQDPIKGEGFSLIYKKVEMATIFADTYATPPPKSKFRLQIVLIPD